MLFKARNCQRCSREYIPVTSRQKYCSLECRFWSGVRAGAPDVCWEWTKAIGTHGYGVIGLGEGKVATCHRMAFELINGPVAADRVVRHSCDNRRCCNPAHLVTGAQVENINDMWSRARQQDYANMEKGERRHNAKLTADAVRAIRAAAGKRSYAEMAREYGVTIGAVSQAARGETWRHVT